MDPAPLLQTEGAVARRLALADLEVLQAQLAAVNADAAVRVLSLRGEGRHFCSGFDVGQVGAAGPQAATRFGALADAIESARPLTVVVVLQGGTCGGAVAWHWRGIAASAAPPAG